MGSFTPQPFYTQGKSAPYHTRWAVVRICLDAVEKRKKCCVAAANQTPISICKDCSTVTILTVQLLCQLNLNIM